MIRFDCSSCQMEDSLFAHAFEIHMADCDHAMPMQKSNEMKLLRLLLFLAYKEANPYFPFHFGQNRATFEIWHSNF